MAAVLDAFAPYVKKLIKDMAEEEVAMLLGISSEITKLEDNMKGLEAFVEDAERRSTTDMSVQRWVRMFKDAMYDATDILDLCQLEADKHGELKDAQLEADKWREPKEKVSGCFQAFLFCLQNPVIAHGIGSRLTNLNQRLEVIHMEAYKFKFITNISSNPAEQRMVELSSYKTSKFNESATVGETIERDTKELVQMLIASKGNDTFSVMSVVGMGGIGKTTLAQKIFEDTTIQDHFRFRIWLSITRYFDECELLRKAIRQAGEYYDGVQDKAILTRILVNTLSTGKFLLVLDDVWSEKAWKHVLSVPVINASQKQPGNRILVTTRLEDQAPRMRASFHQHHISLLSDEDAWCLLKKQLLPYDQVSLVIPQSLCN
ncbi:unnamed protein product [Urochloa humidicola]